MSWSQSALSQLSSRCGNSVVEYRGNLTPDAGDSGVLRCGRGERSRSLGDREDGAPIKDYRGSWKMACIEAGVPGRIVHDFRRTAVRNRERDGVSQCRNEAHRPLTESAYRRYAIVNESDLNEAVAKLQVMMNLRAKAAAGIVTGIIAHDGVQNPTPTQTQI